MLHSKILHIVISSTGESFDLAMFEGMEPTALSISVAARSGVRHFFLTKTPERNGPIIPLSSSLPDGTSLVLHNAPDNFTTHGETSLTDTTQEEEKGPLSKPSLSSSITSPLLFNSGPKIMEMVDKRNTQALPQRPQSFTEEQISSELHGIERFNRLSTDLANERTLLSWIRTALAGIRTAFSYLAITGTNAGWIASLTASQIGMTTLVVVCAVSGVWRYFVISRVISEKLPPSNFGRVSVRPFAMVAVCTVLVTCIGIYSQQWEHLNGHSHA